jgi:hypothetical protein
MNTKDTQKNPKRRSERIRRKKLALVKDAYRLGEEGGIDVAVIVYQYGRYYLAICTKRSCWPPNLSEIVSKPN